MNLSKLTNDQLVIQSISKAAVKTFLQAFLAILVPLVALKATGWAESVSNGESIVLELEYWRNVLIAAAGAGIAALLSLAWNWARN